MLSRTMNNLILARVTTCILFLLCCCCILGNNKNFASALALQPAVGCWRVALDIGREPFSTMPSSWAESGARFPLVVKCNFTDDGVVSSISGDVRYTAAHGEVVTPVDPGTWKLSDDNRHLSFTLNFPQQIERNGVQIGKCTITCQGLLYTEKDLTALDKEFYRVRSVTDEANAQLQEMNRRREAPKKWNFDQEKWVKRYNDENLLSNISMKVNRFVAQKQEQLKSKSRPKPSSLSLESGPFPGIDCNAYIGKKGTIQLNGSGGVIGDGVIGTFAAEPINDNPASYYRPTY